MVTGRTGTLFPKFHQSHPIWESFLKSFRSSLSLGPSTMPGTEKDSINICQSADLLLFSPMPLTTLSHSVLSLF